MGERSPGLRMSGNVRLYRRIFDETRGYRTHIVVLVGLSAMSSVFAILTPLPLKIAVDSVIGHHPMPSFVGALLPASLVRSTMGPLIVASVLYLLISLLKQAQAFGQIWLTTYTGQRLLLNVRSRLFRHAEDLSLAYHDKRGTADSSYRIQYDAQGIENIAVAGFIPFLTGALTAAGMIYVTFRIDWQLALVSIAMVPALVCTFMAYRLRLRRQWHDAKRLDSSALSVVHEALESLRVVKAFGKEDRERYLFRASSARSVAARLRVAVAEGWFGLAIGFIMGSAMAAVLFLGTRRVLAGTLTVGNLTVVVSYLQQLYDPLRTASKKAGDLQASLASAERVYELLDQPSGLPEPQRPCRLARARGDVTFHEVSFAYEQGMPVLQGVNLSVPAGSRVGIAGETGAGKTTLAGLLTRFYDVTGGSIVLDGVDIREYRLEDLRRQYALVLQEPVLFSASVAENIAYARPEATQAEIEAAARAANAHTFIERLPEGYETQVGARGMRLSGGERQRVTLARAFLKDAPVLILDEPTSSVDTRTEAVIAEAMRRLMAGRTTFMIAHRVGTLDGCDIRVEVEDGRLRVAGRAGDKAPRPRPTYPQDRPPLRHRLRSGRSLPRAPAGPGEMWTGDVSADRIHSLLRSSMDDRSGLEALAEALRDVGGAATRVLRVHRLKSAVYRVSLATRTRQLSLVAKRLRPSVAYRNQLTLERWLPVAGLDHAAPRLVAVGADRAGETVWHVYEDVGEFTLEDAAVPGPALEETVRLIATMHARFKDEPILAECRLWGEDHGKAFYDSSVHDAIAAISPVADGSARQSREAGICQQLLARLERLASESDRRADILTGITKPETLLHAKLGLGNVVLRSTTDARSVRLVDWDHVGPGSFSYDLSSLVFHCPRPQRAGVVDLYRQAAAEHGMRLPDADDLGPLFTMAECARMANVAIWPGLVAAAEGSQWAFDKLDAIEKWLGPLQEGSAF